MKSLCLYKQVLMSTNLYVLRLAGGRYYVGKAANLENRIAQHMDGRGSAWTRKYAPVSVVEKRRNASPFEEDSLTLEYMSKYGVDKVRGGSYVEISLNDEQKADLEKKIRSATDACTRCGRKGHFISSCYARTDAKGNELEEEEDEEEEDEEEDELEYGCDYCNRTFTTAFGCRVHEKSCQEKGDTCHKCGREGHYSSECYASRHINGRALK